MCSILPKNKPSGDISLGLGFESWRLRTSLPALPNSRGGGAGTRGVVNKCGWGGGGRSITATIALKNLEMARKKHHSLYIEKPI
jgi:hypothetical protein